MKIVNMENFLKLPPGTVYSEYEHAGFFEGLFVKTYKDNDTSWTYHTLTQEVDIIDMSDMPSLMLESEEKGTDFRMELDGGMRGQSYDKKKLFAVYDKEDLQKLVSKLTDVLNGAYDEDTE